MPALPTGYLERSELGGVRAALLGAGAVGLTGDVHALGMYGQGGIGKTVLAAAAAHDPVSRAYFPGGVFWVTVGEQPDLAGLQASLLSRLGAAGPAPRSAAEGAGLLRQALAGLEVLLVVDDVWSAAAAQAFRVTGPRGRVLYTTRDPAVLAAVGAVAEQVGVLSPAAARQLLARLAGLPEDALPPETDRMLAATGRVALGVALAGAAVRGGATWPQVAGELDRGGDTFLDHPYANTFKALQAATAALDPGLAAAYASLAVFPPDTRVRVAAVSRYWGRLRGIPPEQVRAELRMLVDRELLILDRDEIAFHDLQHSYLLLQADDLALLHADLLASYQALLPPVGTGWWRLPAEEPYIWDHLLYHLLGAGDRSGAASTLTDLAYLAKRIALAGPHAAETDLDQASAAHLDDPRIGWLRRWLARHAHVLTSLADPADVAVTLTGWLASLHAGIDRHRLDPLLPPLYPAPRWGLPVEQPALQRVLSGHTGPVTAVAFSLDGWLASAGDDGTVRLWDPATGAEQALSVGIRRVHAVAFSPGGRRLASAGDDGTVRLWDPATGAELAALSGHTGRVHAVAFSPGGRRLASAGDDGTVRLWDPATGTELAALSGHTGQVTAVAFSPDGRRLASASWRQDRAAVGPGHRHRAGRPVRPHRPGDRGGVQPGRAAARLRQLGRNRAAVGPGHRHRAGRPVRPDRRGARGGVQPGQPGSASAGDDGTVRLWDPATGAELAALSGHTGPVIAVAFSPDGWLASAGDDGTVRLWDPATGTEQASLSGHTGQVIAVAFSPDGRRLASADDDGTVRLWDPATGAGLAALSGHTGPVYAVAFSPDGRRLASAGAYETGRLWDPATGTELAALSGHRSWVTAVAFSLDGRLASAGDDGTVRLWDPATGAEQALSVGIRRVHAVAFSPGGRRLGLGRRRRDRAAVGPGHRRRAGRPVRPHRPGARGGVQPGRAAARLGRRRRDRAAVGPGHRRRAGRPVRPHRPGLRGGVQPGRAAGRLRRRRRDCAAVGRQGNGSAKPSPARRTNPGTHMGPGGDCPWKGGLCRPA